MNSFEYIFVHVFQFYFNVFHDIILHHFTSFYKLRVCTSVGGLAYNLPLLLIFGVRPQRGAGNEYARALAISAGWHPIR